MTSAPSNPVRSITQRLTAAVGLSSLNGYLWLLIIGALLVIAALLSGSGGLAILFTVFIVPALSLRYLTRVDVVERESWFIILAVIVIGGLIGIFIGLINQGITASLWIEHADFNVGAAGYGGKFAETQGRPSTFMILVGGVILPTITVCLLIFAPLFLRRLRTFRNEVMDGITLGAASGFGFATTTAIVYYWPVIRNGANPGVPLEDWTATLLGLAIVRPLLFGLVTAMFGAGIWHYALTAKMADLLFPTALGLGGIILYSIGDLLTQPAGVRTELLWNSVILIVGLVIGFRLVLRKALSRDVQILGDPSRRVICPHCQRVTPIGVFCAHCGQPLTTAESIEPSTGAVLESPTPTPEPTTTDAPSADATETSIIETQQLVPVESGEPSSSATDTNNPQALPPSS